MVKDKFNNIINSSSYNKSMQWMYIIWYSVITFIFLYKIILLQALYINSMYYWIADFYGLILIFLLISMWIWFIVHKAILEIINMIRFIIKVVVNLINK